MKTLYRIQQLGMNLVTRIASQKEPILYEGNDSLYKIVDLLLQTGKTRVFIATTSGFIRRRTLSHFFDELNSHGIHTTIYSDILPDPTVECIEQGVLAYKNGSCEAIIAIGGGSVIDCAKIIGARLVRPNRTIQDMRGTLKIRKQLPDFYAVPTTAGTGSEATAAAVVTDTIDGTHYKYSINDLCLVPKYAVLDPVLSSTLPPHITAATGMDALTHAVETYTNRFASSKVQEHALKAVGLIYENLPLAYQDGANLEARKNMLLGSYHAGIAFTNNFVGYVHAISHAIGALYGVAHGEANAILLPYVLEQYGKSSYKQLAELAIAAGIQGNSHEALALSFIESIRTMNRNMNLPDKVVQLQEKDYETIIQRALKEANPMYPVPVIWGHDDFETLLKKVIG